MQRLFLGGQLEIQMRVKSDIVIAGSSDLDSIKALLDSYHLPTEDIGTSGIEFYLIKIREEIKACAGVESFEETGLLRSVAVKGDLKGKGIGSELISKVLVESKAKNIKTMYLLTETAEFFFSRIGFIRSDRSKAPESIQKSNEFAVLCPASAVLMKKVL